MQKNGIVLFVGRTGSGKSTSLAALIDHRNKNSDCHIITIEDPVEFIHPHQKSTSNQREVWRWLMDIDDKENPGSLLLVQADGNDNVF